MYPFPSSPFILDKTNNSLINLEEYLSIGCNNIVNTQSYSATDLTLFAREFLNYGAPFSCLPNASLFSLVPQNNALNQIKPQIFPIKSIKYTNPHSTIQDARCCIKMHIASYLSGNARATVLISGGKDSLFIYDSIKNTEFINNVNFVYFRPSNKILSEEHLIKHFLAENLDKLVILDETNLSIPCYEFVQDYFSMQQYPIVDWAQSYYLSHFTNPVFDVDYIIDGMGNDFFLGHVPSQRELTKLRVSRFLSAFGLSLSSYFDAALCKSYIVGLYGLTSRYYHHNRSTNFDKLDIDPLIYRAIIRGGYLDSMVFMAKTIYFGVKKGATPVFPWSSEELASIFSHSQTSSLYSFPFNKVLLRDYLSETYKVDFYQLPKRGFSSSLFNFFMHYEEFYSFNFLHSLNKFLSASLNYVYPIPAGTINSYQKIDLTKLFIFWLWLSKRI